MCSCWMCGVVLCPFGEHQFDIWIPLGFHHPWASLAFSSLINMLGRVHLISPVHLAVSFRRASRVHPGFVLSSCGFASCSCVSVSSAHPSVPCSSPPSSRRHAALLGALLRQGRRPVESRAEAGFSFSLISVLGRWFAPSYRRPSFPRYRFVSRFRHGHRPARLIVSSPRFPSPS